MPFAVQNKTVNVYLSPTATIELLQLLQQWGLDANSEWLEVFRVINHKELSSVFVHHELWELQQAFKTFIASEFTDWKLNPR